MFVFIVSVLLYLYLSVSLFACLYITILSVMPEWRINFIINPLTPTVAIWVHPVPDRVKPPFVFFDIWALWRSGLSVNSDAQGWASECPDFTNYKWRLNPVWHRMLYRCMHMATVCIIVLTFCIIVAMQSWNGWLRLSSSRSDQNIGRRVVSIWHGRWQYLSRHSHQHPVCPDPPSVCIAMSSLVFQPSSCHLLVSTLWPD